MPEFNKLFLLLCCVCLPQVPLVVVDSYFYGKLVVAPLNILLYNVFTPHGPDLYGNIQEHTLFFYHVGKKYSHEKTEAHAIPQFILDNHSLFFFFNELLFMISIHSLKRLLRQLKLQRLKSYCNMLGIYRSSCYANGAKSF